MRTPRRFFGMVSALGLAVLFAIGCGNDSTGSGGELLTISGSVTNRTGQAIPSNARVVVAWVVSAGSPDYSYVFGEGTVAANSFRLTLSAVPPAEALNEGELGVGIVLLTTDSRIRSGIRLEEADIDPAKILGATGRYAVIYKAPTAGETLDWAADFDAGYSVGRGVEREEQFDAFAPVPASSMELIVDDLDNIDFVNWT
jgi:hypothetical protein